jgi:hypothetical protein
MLIPYTESAGFDGLALYAEDFQTHLDTSSHWAISSPDNLTYQMIRYVDKQNGIIGNLPPVDYAIVFSDKYSDSSNTFTSLLKYATPGIHNINFKIFDITDRANIQRIKFALVENTAALQDTLSPGDALVLSNSAGSFIGGMIHFINSTSTIVPPAGDTLFLYTQKGLSVFDTILVTGKISDVKYGHSGSIASYSLSQNYPNPFNPSTIIRYELPKAGKVTLKVYNIIGKEVATLVQGEQAAGTHSLVFNAEHLSSGVYFYTLNAGSYIQTRKMLLIK